MIRLLLVVGIVWVIFFWIPSPPAQKLISETSDTVKQKGVRGLVEPMWCGERGCNPEPLPAPPPKSSVPPNLRGERDPRQ
jgi:hypothetical protein